MTDADRLREIFGHTDPLAVDDYVPDTERRERTLRAIVAVPRSRWAPSRRRAHGPIGWLAAAAVIVLVASAGIVVAIAFPRSAPQAWATPAPLAYQHQSSPEPAAPRLLALAAKAAARPPAGPPTQARDHLKIRSWSLRSDIAGTAVTSVVIPAEVELWRDPDNAGSRTVRYLPPEAPTKAQLDAWHDEGSPGADGSRASDEYPPGGFVAVWTDRPPSEPDRLRQWLSSTRQGTDPATTIVTGLTELLNERALSSAETAASLTLLAELPGLRYTGSIRDRVGRTGDAYTVTVDDATDTGGLGLPVTYTFVIDPATGRILALERVLATDNGHYVVVTPAVIAYDTFLLSELVPR